MEVAASARACLVADVGGTNARVGWTLNGQSVQDVVVLRCSDNASLAHILGSYVERMARSHPGMALREAVVAIAGYLQGDRLVNANLPWEVSVARTADAARLESLVLINDFGAVAHAIPGVQRQTLVTLLPGQRDPGMQVPALVLGPGTGLGAAMCLDRAGAEVLLTESGHAALAAGNPLELAVLQDLATRWHHVDNERVLSGTGMMHLYESLARMRGETPLHRRAEQVVAAAHAGEATARQTLDVFSGWLGSLVADLVLTLGAREVYLAGGVTAHIAPFLHAGPFQQRYAARFGSPRVPPPVWRIDHGHLGLIGAAIHWRSRTSCSVRSIEEHA
ncbi:glucokinase [Pseudoxanthomonas mexicana]|uniref:glucokinase n=1 Tax=Pseudoxanthomonas mexicana TaxID=128785 RepID=UPI0020A0AA5C|nr:glucokinase [Pseudoxanthomonas mexicana]MCP1585412.1 glucokinase [Pseudoxanthomonas mexicana]